MSHQDVESLRRIYDAFSRWDVEELVGDLAHDIEWSLPDTLPWGGTRHGHDGVLAFASVSQDHVDGRWADPDDFLDAGDRMVVLGRLRGARQGQRPGLRGRVRPRLDDDRRGGLSAARLLRHRADHGRPRAGRGWACRVGRAKDVKGHERPDVSTPRGHADLESIG
jgi:ketosteroid isomerase-like protein